jgi:hypothetical protein
MKAMKSDNYVYIEKNAGQSKVQLSNKIGLLMAFRRWRFQLFRTVYRFILLMLSTSGLQLLFCLFQN